MNIPIRIALAIGILGLMTLKPSLAVSLTILGVALAGGLLASVQSARHRVVEQKGVSP